MVNSVGTVRQRLQAILEQDRALAAVEELDALRTSLLAAAKAHVVLTSLMSCLASSTMRAGKC